MELYLQFGHNMQKVCCELIKDWGGGTVIMSPRDCKPPDEEKEKPGELEKHAASIQAAGGQLLVDPQFYVPDCDHKTLTKHDFWPETYDSGEFWDEAAPDYGELIKNVAELNSKLKTAAVIVPGTLADAVNDEWLGRQQVLAGEARKQLGEDAELYATVALSADATKSIEQVHSVLAAADGWPVQGVYLICEHPETQYLVEHKQWIANILDITAGLRLRGKKVIIGYANQQMLAAACASATAIAAGSHKNKRRFSSADMMTKDDEDSEQRQTTWYYCPNGYSEFKIPKLDMAKDAGLLEKMRHPAALGVGYADILFTGAQPTTVEAFKHKLSFKHYLGCLHAQAADARKGSFNDTADAYKTAVDTADTLLKELDKKRVRADDRSFLPVVDYTFNAVEALGEDRGAMLRRAWGKL